ncbi:hypothetical protein BO443_70090 [Burkholderia orbicola]
MTAEGTLDVVKPAALRNNGKYVSLHLRQEVLNDCGAVRRRAAMPMPRSFVLLPKTAATQYAEDGSLLHAYGDYHRSRRRGNLY